MSYEFLLFQPRPGPDAVEQAKARLADHSQPEQPSTQALEFKARMQQAILDAMPAYESLETDFEAIAQEEGITLAQAQARFRDVELTIADQQEQPHITIQDDQVVFTLEAWPEREAARQAFDAAWAMLAACVKGSPALKVYDPQLGAMVRLDDSLDRQAASAKYESLVVQVSKPWWKLW